MSPGRRRFRRSNRRVVARKARACFRRLRLRASRVSLGSVARSAAVRKLRAPVQAFARFSSRRSVLRSKYKARSLAKLLAFASLSPRRLLAVARVARLAAARRHGRVSVAHFFAGTVRRLAAPTPTTYATSSRLAGLLVRRSAYRALSLQSRAAVRGGGAFPLVVRQRSLRGGIRTETGRRKTPSFVRFYNRAAALRLRRPAKRRSTSRAK